MPQSNVIFGFVFVAFLIFITSRGELPKYAQVFVGGSGGSKDAERTGAPGAPAQSDAAKAGDKLDRVIKRMSGGKVGLYGGPITDLGNWILDGIDGKK